MPIPLSKVNTKILAKSITYAANAYVDSQIAAALQEFFLTGKFTGTITVPKMRAQQLVGLRKNLTNSYLIGLLYCQHLINGLVNITYAELIKRFIITKHKQDVENIWQETAQEFNGGLPYHNTGRSLISTWINIVGNNPKPIQKYAKENLGYTHPIKLPEVVRACLTVQKQNSAHNLMTAKALKSASPSPDPKIVFLRQCAAKVNHQEVFIQAAASTLVSAAAWDKKFTFLLQFWYRP